VSFVIADGNRVIDAEFARDTALVAPVISKCRLSPESVIASILVEDKFKLTGTLAAVVSIDSTRV
jgi:hypothetical protein